MVEKTTELIEYKNINKFGIITKSYTFLLIIFL